MDNVKFHKGKIIEKLILTAEYYIVWLPQYSLDLNKIEKIWSRVKSTRNKLIVDLIDGLFRIFLVLV